MGAENRSGYSHADVLTFCDAHICDAHTCDAHTLKYRQQSVIFFLTEEKQSNGD